MLEIGIVSNLGDSYKFHRHKLVVGSRLISNFGIRCNDLRQRREPYMHFCSYVCDGSDLFRFPEVLLTV